MTRWIVAGLVVLNVLLGAGVYLRLGGEKTVKAQIGGGRNDFATVSGIVNGQPIVYVLDASTGRLRAYRTDTINRKVELMSGRDIGQDLKRIN